MLRAFIFALVLGVPTFAFAKDRIVDLHHDNYLLRMRARPIAEIPLYRVDMSEVHSQASFMAYLAQDDHPLACRMRDTQERLVWFMAHIQPDGDVADFKWPAGQRLILILDDGKEAARLSFTTAKSIIAYPPDVRTNHAITEIYPGGFACRFSDLDTRHMSTVTKDLFVGIPRRKRVGTLVEIRIVPNPGGP